MTRVPRIPPVPLQPPARPERGDGWLDLGALGDRELAALLDKAKAGHDKVQAINQRVGDMAGAALSHPVFGLALMPMLWLLRGSLVKDARRADPDIDSVRWLEQIRLITIEMRRRDGERLRRGQ
ncbi:MAG: hypothetical protein J0H01_11075 [Rhizobiales bacterium]|nr:hypothetical protein [Hyphomicrobiales bacterium]